MKLLTKLALLVIFIIACSYAFKLGRELQYKVLENEYQMCIDR